jgi:hypothetical protein
VTYYSGLNFKDIEVGAIYTPHKYCKPFSYAFNCHEIQHEQFIQIMDDNNFFTLNIVDIYNKAIMLINIVIFNNKTCFIFYCEGKLFCLPYNDFMSMMKKIM